jgi:hypothetical protein
MVPTAPTGLYTVSYSNKLDIFWIKNPETYVKGYNIYNSTTSGGGVSGYVKLNNNLIEQYSQVRKDIISTTTTVTESGTTRESVTTEVFQNVYVFKYTHENLTEAKSQFYVITAVSDEGEESPYSIEVTDVPLIITTEIVLEPLRTQNDISLDYIATLLERDAKLDIKPGSVTRQLHIDPNSREIAFVYVRRDFVSRSQSFLTLRQLDDANNDRVSDEVSQSSYKQLLKQAFFFENDSDVQNMIDFAFDKLAADAGTFRKPATVSSGSATFYTQVVPTVDITVNLGEIISTVPTETQAAISFETLATVTMLVASINNYYNSERQRYEISVNIQATSVGTIGNVYANTIINTKISGLQVTNLIPTFSGTDEESNADLSDRAELAFVGLDVGTSAGYKKTVTKISGVTDVKIVDAGHPLMQRDYDEVRKKHVYGKVDVYVRGGTAIPYQDTIGFLFKQLIDDYVQIVNAGNMIIKTNNSSVSITKPIFSVSNIINVTKSDSYDLTGNWTVIKNSIEMIKGTEVTMDLIYGRMTFIEPLVFGDVINATYDYKIQITSTIKCDASTNSQKTCRCR